MNPTTAELRRTALILETVAGHLSKHGRDSFRLAEQWAGELAATAATDGSRSTSHNDLSRRVVNPNPQVNDRSPARMAFRPEPEYLHAHQRMTADLAALGPIIARLAKDLDYCQRATAAERVEQNRLDRLNSKTGECEACYPAGREDSYQHGTLEAVYLPELLPDATDGHQHERLDLCHACAVSARGSRAAARSSGTDWDPDEWMQARIGRLRSAT